MSVEEIAAGLSEAQRDCISRAGWMVSKRWRVPWTYGGPVAQSLIAAGLIDVGGYLTPLGLLVRAALSPRGTDG